jgi:hypothetical protein
MTSKISPSLFWNIIGDAFAKAFDLKNKREIEGFWKTMLDVSSQNVAYADHIGRLTSPFTADYLAPWGTIKVDLEDISDISQAKAILAGERYVWSAQPITSSGFVRKGASSSQYVKVNQRALASGGYLTEVDYSGIDPSPATSMDDWEDRFLLSGSVTPTLSANGLSASLPWVQWMVLSDTLENSPSTPWEQVFVLEVDRWDNGANTERGLSLNSYANFGADWEIRLYEDGSSAYVGYGARALTRDVPLTFNGQTVTRTLGSFRDDGFRVGMSIVVTGLSFGNGTYNITAATATSLTLDGASFAPITTPSAKLSAALTVVPTPPSWRTTLRGATAADPVLVEVVMSYNPVTAKITGGVGLNGTFVSVGNMPVAVIGNRRQIFDIYNQRNTINVRLLSTFYKSGSFADGTTVEEALIGNEFSYVYAMPEPILEAKKLQICPWDIRPTGTVISWNGETIVIEIDEDFYGWAPDVCIIGDHTFLLTSVDGDIATLKIQELGTTRLSGMVTIRPWYTEDFSFSEPGVLRTRNELPATTLFILGSRALEVELYETFGKVLALGSMPDSLEYLNMIRGVQYGLFSHPTERNIQNAVSAICGAPYTTRSGIIESVSIIEGELGQELELQINVSGNLVKCDPYWKEFIAPVGTAVEFMGSLVDGVRIMDWVTSGDVLDERLQDRWRKWSTFIVEVSDSLGVTGPGAAAIFGMLNRSKSRHTTFLFSSASNRDEVVDDAIDRHGKFSTIETNTTIVQPHTIEDLVFDDEGEVVNNGLEYQTVDGNEYGEEYQFGFNQALDEQEELDMGQYLDLLRISDPMVNPDGSMYYRSRPMKNESADGRNFLGLYQNFGPRPYSLLRIYDGLTSGLVTYNGGRWYERSVSSVTDMWSESADLSYACVTTNVLESYDRGYTWASAAVTGATGNATKIRSGYAVGIGATKYWKRVGVGSWQEFTAANIVGSPSAIDSVGTNVWTFWQGTNEILMSKSTNSGTSWSVGAVVASGASINVFDARFVDANHGAIATTLGLWVTDDGGSTWTQYGSSHSINNLTYLEDVDTLVASIASTGNIIKFSGIAEESVVAGSPIATGGSSLLKVSGGNNYVFAVQSGTVYRSKDYGVSWSTAMTGIAGTPYALATSENGLMRLAGGTSIWAWF